MAQLVTIQQAARSALSAWLATELADVEGLVVEDRWFEADRQLPAKSISIIDAGPREIEWLDPEVIRTTNVDVENGVPVKKVDATWRVGFITQRVQIDVWARTEPELTDIIARLDLALNKSVTEPFRPGLELALGDGWAPGIVDFLFDAPQILQSPISVGEGEWRAMYRGRATAQLTHTARSPRIARILVEQRLRTQGDVDEADAPDVTEITSDS